MKIKFLSVLCTKKPLPIIIIAVLLIGMFFCSASLSKPNPNQPISQGKSGKLTKQKSTKQITPPPDFMTAQQLIDAIHYAIESITNKAKATQNSRPPDNYSYWFSLFLVIFTGGLVVVGIIQCYIIFKTLNATTIAANAAKDSANIAKDTLYIAERAYIAVDNFNLGRYKEEFVYKWIEKTKEILVDADIVNIGHTPGFVKEIFAEWDVVNDIPAEPTYNEIKFSSLIINPGRPRSFAIVRKTPMTEGEYDSVRNGIDILLVWGKVIYADKFGKIHAAGFGVKWIPPEINVFVPVLGYNYDFEYEENENKSKN